MVPMLSENEYKLIVICYYCKLLPCGNRGITWFSLLLSLINFTHMMLMSGTCCDGIQHGNTV